VLEERLEESVIFYFGKHIKEKLEQEKRAGRIKIVATKSFRNSIAGISNNIDKKDEVIKKFKKKLKESKKENGDIIEIGREDLKSIEPDLEYIKIKKENGAIKVTKSEMKFILSMLKFRKFKDEIGEKNLGKLMKEMADNVDAVLHPAANVKHIGNWERDFLKPNVTFTEQLLKFCMVGEQKDFHFISTLSTGEGSIPGKNHLLFTEYTHDEGQRSDNFYVKSKLEAEKRVLYCREKELLKTSIYRAANMTFHSETGIFQKNINENSFYAMLKAIIKVGFWSDKIKDMEFDLSFVNRAADAIVRIMTIKQLENETYHICNPNRLSWKKMEELLKEKETCIKVPKTEEVKKEMVESEYDEIKSRVEFYSWEEKSTTLTVPKIDRTVKLLEKLGFTWPEVNKQHIDKMIAHCKKVKFL
jgi:thioester reductase-like protein